MCMFYMFLWKGGLYTLFFDSGGRAPCHGIVLDTCLRGFVQFAFSRTIAVKIVIAKKLVLKEIIAIMKELCVHGLCKV